MLPPATRLPPQKKARVPAEEDPGPREETLTIDLNSLPAPFIAFRCRTAGGMAPTRRGPRITRR